MAMEDDGRIGPTNARPEGGVALSEDALRDLAMREVLGLLDDAEAVDFEKAFTSMTPDDQAAVLDLQAAVAREIAGGGVEEPDRALRYKVLARMTEEIAGDLSISGPIAVIGGVDGPGRRRSIHRTHRQHDAAISELQFERVRRSAAVWRAASFALAAATITISGLLYQGQTNVNQLLGSKASEVIAERFGGLFGTDLDIRSFLEDSIAVASSLASVETGKPGAGMLLRRGKANDAGLMPAALLCVQLPEGTTRIGVFAVPNDGSEDLSLGELEVAGSTVAAVPLELGEIDLPNVRFEVRDLDTGAVILRTAIAA
ncbi:MAG: hypothetical protein RLZZ461_505 [Planctomycetota bacterium]|jgi:hypothetical protein